MSSFAALMALSQTQTQRAEEEVKVALAERQRKEAQRRKEQEERDRKDRELEAKLRARRLEEDKREEERRARLEAERAAKDRAAARRAEEERNQLRFGGKRTVDKFGYPVSAATRRRSSDSDDDSPGAGANALTREEKRRRRLEAEMRVRAPAKRASGSGYHKAGRRLPGGAMNITTTQANYASDMTASGGSVKARIAAMAPKLIKLNENKRDTRTIDEILRDRAKQKAAKQLVGEEAREFNDWFGKGKKVDKAASQVPSASTSRANTPSALAPPSSQPAMKVASGSLSPHSKASTPRRPASPAARPVPSSAKTAVASSSKLASASRPLDRSGSTGSSMRPPAGSVRPAPSLSSLRATTPGAKPMAKKRPRSPSLSLSPSPPPMPKKRATERGGGGGGGLRDEIWKMFGKDRNKYTARDIYSDDEDMEAGASDLEKEELRSARLAKKEDELALEEERRHEEEKRRKRREKDVRDRRGRD